MHTVGKTYSVGAVTFLRTIREMRAHIEYEKFLCRVLKDDERTQEFEQKTANLKDQIYNYRYNNVEVKKLTKAGKANASKS